MSRPVGGNGLPGTSGESFWRLRPHNAIMVPVHDPRSTQETATLPLLVQKFGGTSVATAERIMAAARRAIRARQAGHQVLVVVSARGDTTDDLIELAREITDAPPAREMDMLLSTGEQISIALTAMAVHTLGQPA